MGNQVVIFSEPLSFSCMLACGVYECDDIRMIQELTDVVIVSEKVWWHCPVVLLLTKLGGDSLQFLHKGVTGEIA